LPRRSYLTARNDDVPFCKGIAGQARNDDLPFYSHVSRHCEARSKPENHSIHSIKKNHSSDNFSGLPRRSYLTARNDDLPFYSHVSRHCEARSKPENHSLHSQSKKIIVQTNNQINKSTNHQLKKIMYLCKPKI